MCSNASYCIARAARVARVLQARIASLSKRCSVGIAALWCAALLLFNQLFAGVADIAVMCSPFAGVAALSLMISHFASVAHSLALQGVGVASKNLGRIARAVQ